MTGSEEYSCFEPERRYAILREIFDSLSEHIAVLDHAGCIVEANASWRRFAQENANQDQCRIDGENYIEVCENASGEHSAEALQAAAGIREVLAGRIPVFRLEYPCHSPTQQRWFLMMATPLADAGVIDGAVVSHIPITARKLAEMALIRYERAVASSTSLVSIVDRNFIYLLVNESYLRVHARERTEIEGRNVSEIMGRDAFEQHVRPRLERAFAGLTEQYEAWFDTAGLGRRCYQVVYYPYRERDNSITGAVVTATDVTEARLLQDEVANSARRLAEAQRLAKVGSFEKDFKTGTKSWSDELYRILGYEPGAVEPDFNMLMHHIHPDDASEFQDKFIACEAAGEEFTTGLRVRTLQGREKHVSLVCGFDLHADGNIHRLHGAMADVTERRLAELRLERLANTDALTGLANRRHFLEKVRVEIARSLRFGKALCVGMIDIDDFKKVNDTHGHGVGDEALRHVTKTLTRMLRRFDHLGRLGGEEFCVLLPETDLKAGLAAASRMVECLATAPLDTDGLRLRLTVSIGVAQFVPDKSLEALLREADEALYEAKRKGKNRVHPAE
jgi:diguanylate cyclase (GGDEF)-like protein/PAS domain S-box-containing protein